MTLTDFLLARIAEDEAVARGATPGPWAVDNPTYAEQIRGGDGYTAVVAGGRWGGEASVFETTEDAIHIARHDPARVLADCAAKRRIVERVGEQHTSGPELDWVVSVHASVYADHPDYREEWKP